MTRLPENLPQAVELIFPVAWYDGPLSGLCRHQGKLCWFDGNPREQQWTVYRLTQEERSIEAINQQRFEELVGTHWSFETPRAERTQRGREQQAQYYEQQNSTKNGARRKSYRNPARTLVTITNFTNNLARS